MRYLLATVVVLILFCLLLPVFADQERMQVDNKVQGPGCAKQVLSALGLGAQALGDKIAETPGLGLWGLVGGTFLSALGGLFAVDQGQKASLAKTAMRGVIAGVAEAKAALAEKTGDAEGTKRIFREKIQGKTTQLGVQAYVDQEVQEVKKLNGHLTETAKG